MRMATKTVIITAGGIGKRMGSDLPKQFLLLDDLPVLAHSIERFHRVDPEIQILVTLPDTWRTYWEGLCRKISFKIPHTLVDGGKERFHSIRNALKLVTGELVAVHDGVRPLVSRKLIFEAFQLAEESGTALPVVPVKESVRFVEKLETRALNRKNYFIVQTPQVFRREVLQKSYELPYHEGITDDASLAEEAGYEIRLLEGEEFNVKITTPFDLKLIRLIYEENKSFYE
ncbi:MAG: 2-C-methyl-D-erythritol 4-phosphate cytidylyltransferase [Crocinitomicaceae bacterium]|jgi:2-C-methyl-D-erythritol 4-phosphate cytidylyltransferase|nr:2-C-methyl-D-erythritol 4-phosphate cytidylyltransferase [Crocinitomicaceae bacterium]